MWLNMNIIYTYLRNLTSNRTRYGIKIWHQALKCERIGWLSYRYQRLRWSDRLMEGETRERMMVKWGVTYRTLRSTSLECRPVDDTTFSSSHTGWHNRYRRCRIPAHRRRCPRSCCIAVDIGIELYFHLDSAGTWRRSCIFSPDRGYVCLVDTHSNKTRWMNRNVVLKSKMRDNRKL